MVTDGAAGCAFVTVTVVELCALPTLFEQLKMKVVGDESGPVLALPLVAFVPDHPFNAVHCSASCADHVSVADAPLATVC